MAGVPLGLHNFVTGITYADFSSGGPAPAPVDEEAPAEERQVRLEISNLLLNVTADQLRREVLAPALRSAGLANDGVIRSVSGDTGQSRPGIGTVVVLASAADRLVQAIHGQFRPLSYRKPACARGCSLTPPSDIETRAVRRWPFLDPTALSAAEQAAANAHHLELLFSRVPAGEMRDSLWREVQGRSNLKEFYLAYGRRLELVFAGDEASRKNNVLRSNERVGKQH
jgi:hypothetical protein